MHTHYMQIGLGHNYDDLHLCLPFNDRVVLKKDLYFPLNTDCLKSKLAYKVYIFILILCICFCFGVYCHFNKCYEYYKLSVSLAIYYLCPYSRAVCSPFRRTKVQT